MNVLIVIATITTMFVPAVHVILLEKPGKYLEVEPTGLSEDQFDGNSDKLKNILGNKKGKLRTI